MSITYKDIKIFQPKELQDLFLSVKWESGKHPEKLVIAMENSKTVFSAWDNEKLVGLINAFDDSIMTVYVHFLLVNPEYQGKSIGKELLRMVSDKYKDYLRVVLITDEKTAGFYENSGFSVAKGSSVLMINRF